MEYNAPVMMESNNIYHPPFNHPMRPDLGGTSFDFSKEIKPDKVTFTVGQDDRFTKLIIPSKESYLAVTVEEDKTGIFIEAYYDFTGQLSLARLWFKCFCGQRSFNEKIVPDDNLINALGKLNRSGTDIALEADLEKNQLKIYHCEDNQSPGRLKILNHSLCELPRNSKAFALFKGYGKVRSTTPVKFAAGIVDNTLSLGFCPNKKQLVDETISTNVKMDILYGGTPAKVKHFLELVFLQED